MASDGKTEVITPKPTESFMIDLDSSSAETDSQAAEHQTRSSWKHLFAFTKKKHAGPLVAALLSSAFSAALKTVLAIILGKIFDIVADFGNGKKDGKDTLTNVSQWCLVLVGLGIGNWLASSAFLASWVVFGELQANSVREDVFSSLLSRGMAWFDSLYQGISSLLVRVQTQTRELQLATSQVLGLLICDTMASIASLGVAFYFSWKLTLVLLATVPVSMIVMSLATKRLEPAIQAQKHNLETASKLATASINAIDLVKVFNGFDHELRQYYQAVKLAGKQYLVQAQCNAIQMGYVSFWVIALFLVGFWYGVVLVNQGLAPGHVLTTFYATLAAFQGIEALLPHWLVLSKGMAAGSFLSLITTDPGDAAIGQTSGSLKLEYCVGNVSFAYPSNPSKKVLNTSSFSFPASETTFIVGRSGSGKSTIGNLIAKFYEPLTGTIWFDGHPLNTFDARWIQSHIALIQQSSIVFNDTVFNNIAVGHPDAEIATRDDIISACEFALLQLTLNTLPEGLDTTIGANGHKLSGGQRQRLALARARLRDPTVLILDEVTSSLDQISRSLIMDAIREWRREKTTIIITHDVSQIHDDDFVYVMEDASLVQRGFKRDLIQADGPYAAMDSSVEPSLTPIDMRVLWPDTSADSSSPVANDTPDWASFASRFILNELENDEIRTIRNRLSQQPSLGIGTAVALRLRKAEIWEAPVLKRPKSLRKLTLPALEKPPSSTMAGDRPSTAPEHKQSHTPNKMDDSFQTDDSDDSVFCTEDPDFLFGAAERRENIPELRLARTRELLSPSEEAPAPKPPTPRRSTLWTTLGTVWPSLSRSDRIVFVLGMIICIIGAAGTPVFSFCFAKLLGAMWSSGDKMAEGKKWAIFLVITAIIDGLTTAFGHYMMERTGQAWVNSIRAEAMRRILRQPKSWFDKEKNSASRINECLERNSEEMRNIVGRFIPIVGYVICIISISVTWAMVVSWELTLVALSPLPVVVGAVKGYTAVSSKWETRCNQGAEEASAMLNEILVNIRVVRALTLESHFGKKYRKLASQTLGFGLRRAGYTCGLFGLYQSMSYPLTALVFYYAATVLSRNQGFTTTEVLQVVNLLLFSIGNATDSLGSMPQLTMAQATATQLLAYAKLPLNPPEESSKGKVCIESILPIMARGLTFAYPQNPEEQVLRGVSFDIRPGICTAIVGSSGCGKSTIISLLMGLYAPGGSSQLSFANVPFSQLDVQHLRSRMAYVSQSPFLFPATIAENIAYGLPKESPYRSSINIYAAAQAAGIHDFIISLPGGYTTIVGEGGISLSGGQAQRLSIARALVREPQLLILDEPTSALDTECSSMIRETISTLVEQSKQADGDMAIVLVTHSRDMMQVATNIIMIDGGVKVEEGSYEDLLRAGGPFRHLVSGGEWSV
ncbi:Alpha-factor-transporting ATPase [Cladobotryum mycophilum]|uniref:Alpha-factor-transporting ATPase n=1 Tax=Cladobotryum mycophilum TaxID=491253 RepID=A0ABR0SLG9_9HYPO